MSKEIIQQKSNNYMERAVELLNKNEVNEKDLIDFLNELRKNPLIEIDIKENLLNTDSFEIFEKVGLNPIFILNLINIINIVNFIWNSTKKNIDIFHKILLELNIMFSFVPNGKQIEFVLLSTIPLHFYELVAKKGKSCFKKNYPFDKDYLSYDKNNAQIGLVNEANTVAQLNSLLNNKELDAPTIMYYLNHNKCIEMYQNKIFNKPVNFLDLKYDFNPKYHGYNEIGHSFILEENIELKQNLILNKVMENNEIIRYFNSNDKNGIKSGKDTNIFVEIKSNFDSSKYITDLKDKSDQFAYAYSNTAFDGLEIKFKKEKSEYFLLYNNRDDAFEKLKKPLDDNKKEIDNNNFNKDINVLYNIGYVQIVSIVSLQNQILSINNKMDNMIEEREKEKLQMEDKMEKQKNEYKGQMEIQKNQLEEKMELQKKELEKKMESQQKIINQLMLDNKIHKFILSHLVNLDSIKNIFEKLSSNKNALNFFKNMNAKYIKFCSEILEDDNKIINTANKIIGKFLTSNEEIEEFFNFLSFLDEKISENTHTKKYYQAFKEMLIGPSWKNSYQPSNIKQLDIFSKTNYCYIIKNIIKFIVVFDMHPGLENQFFEAILFYVDEISKCDIKCFNLFFIYSKKEDIPKTIINFIKSLNSQFHDSLIKI